MTAADHPASIGVHAPAVRPTYGPRCVSVPCCCTREWRCLGESSLLTPAASAAAAKRRLAPEVTLSQFLLALLTLGLFRLSLFSAPWFFSALQTRPQRCATPFFSGVAELAGPRCWPSAPALFKLFCTNGL